MVDGNPSKRKNTVKYNDTLPDRPPLRPANSVAGRQQHSQGNGNPNVNDPLLTTSKGYIPANPIKTITQHSHAKISNSRSNQSLLFYAIHKSDLKLVSSWNCIVLIG